MITAAQHKQTVNTEGTAAHVSSKKEAIEKKSGTKRYNLVLPDALFEEINNQAKQDRISILEVIKRLIKIGLVVTKIVQSPGSSLIIRQGEKERELVLL